MCRSISHHKLAPFTIPLHCIHLFFSLSFSSQSHQVELAFLSSTVQSKATLNSPLETRLSPYTMFPRLPAALGMSAFTPSTWTLETGARPRRPTAPNQVLHNITLDKLTEEGMCAVAAWAGRDDPAVHLLRVQGHHRIGASCRVRGRYQPRI